MSWILPRLNQRVHIFQPYLNPNDQGGIDLIFGDSREFLIDDSGNFLIDDNGNYLVYNNGDDDTTIYNTPIKKVWMGFKPIGYKGTGSKYVRGKQVSELATHEFICRYLSVASLGKAFNTAFSTGFKEMGDLNPLKSQYFLFVKKGSNVKGRLFRIHDVQNVYENDEYLSIVAEEIEERGTGYEA